MILGALGAFHPGRRPVDLPRLQSLVRPALPVRERVPGLRDPGQACSRVVTGAEALHVDHGPLRETSESRPRWLCLVFPCLALNYLGRGSHGTESSGRLPQLRARWEMVPCSFAYWPVLLMATVATVTRQPRR
ncbi:KUP/HAK/KT family potassium transporter [Caulobacter segnis]